MNKLNQPVTDTAAAFDRLVCLSHLVTATREVDAWHQVPFDERATIEARLKEVSGPLLDGPFPASPSEKRLASRYPEMWSRAERLNAGWRNECVALLAWALQLRDERLQFDRQVCEDALIKKLVDPTSRTDLRARAQLRAREELEEMHADSERWWWRATQARPEYQALTKPTSTLSKKKQDRVRAAVGSPVSLFGRPYEKLTFFEASTAFSIAMERLKAIGWVFAGGSWDDAKPETSDL